MKTDPVRIRILIDATRSDPAGPGLTTDRRRAIWARLIDGQRSLLEPRIGASSVLTSGSGYAPGGR
jgi:hypothetical protein